MSLVRPGRVASPGRGESGQQRVSNTLTFPAPNSGLVTSEALGVELPGAASVLQNFIPTLTGCRIRGGSAKRGALNGAQDCVSSFKYRYGSIEKIFVTTATAIFEVTSPATPPATTAAVVTGLTSGDFSVFQHATASGAYLLAVNGTDTRRTFDGTTWGTAPAMTFTDGTTSAQLNYGFLFKNREFYLKNGTLDAYYMTNVDAIGGAATVFPLGGVMKKGGRLLTGFQWSIESGDGPNDYCVFISTEGEVAVYAGSNPASSTDWALKGLYQIGKPLGKNTWIKSGADVLVATFDGLTAMSQIFARDKQALSLVSLSRAIEDDWRAAANATGDRWEFTLWAEQNLILITFPDNTAVPDTTFVLNTLTGKWSFITNWSANCYETYNGSLFFGSLAGGWWQADTTGTDNGLPFSAVYLSRFTSAGQLGSSKTATLAQMRFRAKTKPAVKLFARADDDTSYPTYSVVSLGDSGASEWDVGLWDVALWDADTQRNNYKFRQNVRATGEMLAVGCVITSGGPVRLDLEVDLALLQVEAGDPTA